MIANPHVRPRNTAIFPRPVILAAVFAVLATMVLADVMPRVAPGLLRFEHVMADWRTATFSDQLPTQHAKVAVVGITDQTLSDFKTRIPIDRGLLAKVVDAVDAAGAKVIGVDILFFRPAPGEHEQELIDALRRAKAKVVLGAGDERVGMSPKEAEFQKTFIAQIGRPAGFVNLATERDWVVRFKALPAENSAFPKSFAQLMAESAGYAPTNTRRRIAWLRTPRDGSDTFQTVTAETLLGDANDPMAKAARDGLKDKIVIIGGLFPDIDQHQTPMTSQHNERMAGAIVHAHIAAELVDGRSIVQLEGDSLVLRLELAVLAGLGFLVGWRYRLRRQGLLLGSIATAAIIAIDTFVFWQLRIILPIVLALLAWFLGEFSGHNIGRWLGHPGYDRKAWFFR
jgi:CHASE2 domain-containing sensor protein